jgi:hypothetical protein
VTAASRSNTRSAASDANPEAYGMRRRAFTTYARTASPARAGKTRFPVWLMKTAPVRKPTDSR